MPILLARMCNIHRFLTHRSCYPLIVASLLAGGLLGARIYLTSTPHFLFLTWNLFLAWIPYFASLWADRTARRYPERWWRLLLPGALWLVFLPNAPYLLTDLIHLKRAPEHTLIYDAALLAAFAWAGCLLATASLRMMHIVVTRHLGTAGGWLFVLVTLGLSGMGVYIGRFLRWNSWDVLLNPFELLSDVLQRAVHARAFGTGAIFAALLLACYLGLTATARQPSCGHE